MTRDQIMNSLRVHGPATTYGKEVRPEWAAGLRRHIPEHMWLDVVRWVLLGEVDDEFLRCVIEGDLFGAAAVADDLNRYRLFDYAVFFHNYAPALCFKRMATQTWRGVCDA